MAFFGAFRRSLGLCALAVATAAVSQPAAKPLQALSRLEPGLWQVRAIDNPKVPSQSICVADPGVLMQLQHRQSPCSRFIISNDAQAVTVHYTCPANGFGRTSLRVETSRLAKIDTQGIIDNAPFAWRAEARRLGPCPSAAAKAPSAASRPRR